MTAAKSDLLQGTLDLLILQVVAPGPLHGYAIGQRLQQLSKEALQVQQGSLYPALHRLELRGWLKAEWKNTETGREAKFYGLTKAGRKTARYRAAQLGAAVAGDRADPAHRPNDSCRSSTSWWDRFRPRDRRDQQGAPVPYR